MKRFKYFAIVCAAIVVVGFWVQRDTRCLSPINIGCQKLRAKIGDGTFSLRVARTETERARGLGGARALAKDEGMLFEFPQDGFHAIWMKDMLIPIDIVWLSDGLEVVDIRKSVSPDSFPEVFAPSEPARFVVELVAGSTEALRIKKGSRAEFFAD